MVSITTDAQSFYKKLKDNDFTTQAITVTDDIIIDNAILDWEYRQIKNVTFLGLVRINNVDIKTGLAFEKCKFDNGIVFNGVLTSNFDSSYTLHNSNVFLKNCSADFLNITGNSTFERGFYIINCEINDLTLKSCKIGNGGLKLKDSKILRTVDLDGVVSDSLRFEKSTFEGASRFSSIVLNSFTLMDSEFNDWFRFFNVRTKSLTLNRNVFNNTFTIESSIIEGFFIHGDTFHKKARLENRDTSSSQNINTSLDEIYITEAKFIEGFEFDGMGKELQKSTLPLSPNFQGVLRFVGWKINKTSLTGLNESLKLTFKRISFRSLTILDFSNSGDITFDRSGAENTLFKSDKTDDESHIITSDSSFGLTKFTEFNFKSFDFIRIDNVSFDGIVTSNVEWFEDSKVLIDQEGGSSSDSSRRRREIYRQIKQSLKSRGNQIDSLIFQAREMNAYRNELKHSGNYTLSDRIIMLVNRTNSYGLNWAKPTLILIILTIIWYLLSLPLFTEELWYSFKLPFADFSTIINVASDRMSTLANMFNPVRRFSTTYGSENISSWLYFFDLFHRIVIGVLIFQIIRAFRRLASK